VEDGTTRRLLDRIREGGEKPALVRGGLSATFAETVNQAEELRERLHDASVRAGDVVLLRGDFSPGSAAALLALASLGAICVPDVRTNRRGAEQKMEIAGATMCVDIGDDDGVVLRGEPTRGGHPYYEELVGRGHPGLVLFTSGSTGEPKAAVHDLARLLEKFLVLRPAWRTLAFLVFDHWGGLNTLFHALANGSTLVALQGRDPDDICALIEAHRVELLPASPTFLNLLLMSRAYERHDLSSLRVITYGTEPMPEPTLRRLVATFPGVKLQQTYGLIEVGVLRSQSRSADSLWVRLGGEGFQTRVREGMLEIRAESAMLGYLNAPSPFTEDGWFMTGDAVEVDGDFFRILGRKSELINVGGEKVYPAEVEGVIQEMENVVEATVWGERNALVGRVVCAQVLLKNPEDPGTVARRVKAYCRERLEPFKVPVRVVVGGESTVSERMKKNRRGGTGSGGGPGT